MEFVYPAALALLLTLPFVIVFLLRRDRMREADLRRVGNDALIISPRNSVHRVYRKWKLGLWTTAVAALIVAIAQPIWGEDVSIIETQGVSVMVVLDVSKSMDAPDMTPSRLGRAKLAILDLLKELAGNEIGLILFAGSAFVQFPLTTDTLSAATFLEAASSDSVSRQGTDAEAALQLAINSFDERLSSHRFIILLTDGESHEGNPLAAAGDAAAKGITIHSIGYGSIEGAAIPIRDGNGNEIGLHLDQAGNPVSSRLDEATLLAISERTGGTYLRASSTGEDIRALVQNINSAQSGDLGSRMESQRIERFSIFVMVALLALTLEIVFPEVRREGG